LSKIILVGVDGSQPAKKALEYAANLASKNGNRYGRYGIYALNINCQKLD
jgi:nucleotide-binding universal stress UspA family protein